MATNPVPTEIDFQIAFNALRDRAAIHGINTNMYAMRNFLTETAEYIAQEHANLREALSFNHLHEDTE